MSALARIPRGVWALGFVSLCMDLSSELIHALLPLYMAVGLGASTLTIGIVEGIAEATALIVKVFSGVLSDFFRRRKPLVVLGYGLAAFTKLVFPLAPTLGWIVTARFADRVGKGIRGAPRDALIADLSPPEVRGASFGLRQALDTVGGVGGPLLAIGAMSFSRATSRRRSGSPWCRRFSPWRLLVFGVEEPARPKPNRRRTRASGAKRLRVADAKRLGRDYAIVVGIAAVLTLARFSEAFLVLRAQNVGLPTAMAPWVMVVMSIVYAAVSYPAGSAADRGHGPRLLSGGLIALIASDLVLANAHDGADGVRRRRPVGPAHGADPGPACGAGGRRGAGRPARNGVRRLQSRLRHRAARCERACGRAVGCVRSRVHVLRRRSAQPDRVDRVVALCIGTKVRRERNA